jgi:hypothetical protein
MYFRILNDFFGIYKPKIKFQKWGTVRVNFSPSHGLLARSNGQGGLTGPCRGCGVGAVTTLGYRARQRGAVLTGGAPVAEAARGLWEEHQRRAVDPPGKVGWSGPHLGSVALARRRRRASAAAFLILAKGSCSKVR